MKTPSISPSLLVRNFGPIKTGFRECDGFIHFPAVTAFCGPQGSGKSTIAKLFSTCSFIEKQAFRNEGFIYGQPIDVESFRTHTDWQGLGDCFRAESEIVFVGLHLSFRYANGKISILPTKSNLEYRVPKIMYMPAERNIASVVKEAPGIKTLPQPLQELLVEFETAKRRLSHHRLPVNGFSYLYDRKTNESWIVNGRKSDLSRTHLELASSGLQSMVPLLLVTENIAATIAAGANRDTRFGRSPSELLLLRKHLEQLFKTSDDVPKDLKDEFIRRFTPSMRFINIVEEPEQNLFPPAQDEVLNRLLEIVSGTPGNQLVLSTHSPYLVNDLVLSAKAAALYHRIPATDILRLRKLGKIVPRTCAIDIADMALYETGEDGSISKIPVFHDTFDDNNALNTALGSWNRKFENLLDIEDELPNEN